MNYNSDYDVRLKMLESLGGDITRKYDSVYSIDLEILRLMEQGGGGGGVVIQNYKGLIADPNTELIKSGDLGYNEVLEPNVKYSKYFTFLPNSRTLFLKIPSGISKTFLKVQKSGDVYDLYVNKLNEDGTYTWQLVQINLQDLPALTKVPFTYIFYDETLSKNVEFPCEFAWSLDRQEIYYTSTVEGWIPELKMKGATEWNEGFYDISAPETFTKKQRSFYVKDGDGNVINTNVINGNSNTNSSKVVRISADWAYVGEDLHQKDIKKALEDIYNEISKNRSVTFVFNGYYTQLSEWVIETSSVVVLNKNDISILGLGFDKSILEIRLGYDEGRNHYTCSLIDNKYVMKGELYSPYIYVDGRININTNGRISELISEQTVDNEEFVVVKTTVPAYTGTDTPHHQVYYALRDDYGNNYLLTKFGGMKLWWDQDNANFDLLPDGEWYIIFNEMTATTYTKIIITKAVRNVDGTLDVYLGFKGYDLNSLAFWDCTVENRDMQGGEGKWNEKNWTKVSDAQNISVDSFMGRRTRYFCTNTEGVKVDKITLFKRMK